MGAFDLPSNWVYINYKDGHKENVASTDILDKKFADSLYNSWSKKGAIKSIDLVTSDNKVIKTFLYEV